MAFKEFWGPFVERDEYRTSLARRILTGRAPHAEKYLLEKLFGKP